MAEKIWLRQYPEGVPAEIDPDAFASIPDMLERTAARFGDKPALDNLGRTVGYRELARLSRDFAAYLQGLPGMGKGERVAVMMPNLLQYPVAMFGILRAGLTVVNVNPLYTPRELAFQLQDAGVRAIVILENFAHTLEQVIRETPVEHVVIARVGDLLAAPKRWLVDFVVRKVKKMVPAWRIDGAVGFRKALAAGDGAPVGPMESASGDIAFLQYTGGTTGMPKGAVLTHRNILANIQQTAVWLTPRFREGEEIVIAPLPMYHIFCLTSTMSFLKWGSRIVLVTNPRDLPGFVKELGKWRFTAMTGVNTLFNALLNTPGFERLDFSGVKVVVGGGAAVQQAVADSWHRVTGSFITEAYGLTETCPGVCANLLGTPWNGTVGLPFSSTEVSIRNEDFAELPVWSGDGDREAHTGEICVRGPQVMAGYWNQPEETASALRDGWLKTGDVGHMNADGSVTITDRKKDVILVSGFNVYPNEVENVIASHPGVLECGVTGVPDPKTGEAVIAVVVRKDPGLTAEAVIAYSRGQLTRYKVPVRVEFRETLPKSPIGKVLRRQLGEANRK